MKSFICSLIVFIFAQNSYAEILEIYTWKPYPGKAEQLVQDMNEAAKIHSELGITVTISALSLGTTGDVDYVMSYEDGRIFWDPLLEDFTNEKRTEIYDQVISVLAAIHNIDIEKVGLSNFGKKGNYFERQLKRWTSQYRLSETSTLENMDSLIAWLEKNLPDDQSSLHLIHGDFRLDNLILHPSKEKVIAVLDWELSTLGNPIADLAYFCMGLRLPKTNYSFGLKGHDRKSLGIPEEEMIIEKYCHLRGIDDIENWPFYLAFSFFRLAAICQGVYKRSLIGNASNKNANLMENFVIDLSSMAVEIIKDV